MILTLFKGHLLGIDSAHGLPAIAVSEPPSFLGRLGCGGYPLCQNVDDLPLAVENRHLAIMPGIRRGDLDEGHSIHVIHHNGLRFLRKAGS